ncbi:hypothetical protein OH491_24570 [Termitidicoccus mucosus]|uniref:YcxB family protein n=1 Tax=Termitidicoccus mucosus TaxID=1184151 RepID=UPI0011AB7F45
MHNFLFILCAFMSIGLLLSLITLIAGRAVVTFEGNWIIIKYTYGGVEKIDFSRIKSYYIDDGAIVLVTGKRNIELPKTIFDTMEEEEEFMQNLRSKVGYYG